MSKNPNCIHMCQNKNIPMLDIIMLTYNHEDYIGEAIKSVLMQKTKYSYKIKIGEDCSTDSTREIIMDYYRQYPDKIDLYLWEENVGGARNVIKLISECKGEYVATLEGDDYWTDLYKLEKQISFLENNKEYIGTAHNIRCVDRKGKMLHCDFGVYPVLEEHIYGRYQAEKFEMVGQTASLLYRNIWKNWSEKDLKNLFLIKGNGDIKINILLGLSGDIYFFRDIMANHRRIFIGDSWTAKSHNKNMLWCYYSSYCAIKDYMKKYKHISMNMDNIFEQLFKQSWTRLLCDFSKENAVIFDKFLKIKLGGHI